MKNRPPRLGAHMSIAGGMRRAIERAEEVGATALQVFVKSARQWQAPPLVPEQVEAFRRASERAGLTRYTLAHASYLINLASPDPALRQRSVRALGDEVDRCGQLGIPYLVLHPGSHVGAGEEAGLERVARGLDRVLDRPASNDGAGEVMVLLETTAGQGTNLGHRFEQLASILEQAQVAGRLGVCFDTCHALAAGYEFREGSSFRSTFRSLDAAVGLDRLRAFHLNDSMHELGSRRDRHEHIGDGALGLEPFRLILADERFRGLPMVLETPKDEDLGGDRRNLELLRSLLR